MNQAPPQQGLGSGRSGSLPRPNGTATDRDKRKQEAAARNTNTASAKAQISKSKTDPIAFWDKFYADPKANDDPEDVLALVSILRVDKKFRDIEGILRGYLRHHSDLAEVWMYDTLVIAIDINKGDMEEAKSLVGFAAHLARQSENPNDLFQVADILLLRNWLDPVGIDGYKANLGEILERLQKRVPHRIEPYLMNMLLAERTQNPGRMAEVAESILSIGWGGRDAAIRSEMRLRCQTLSKTLRADDRSDEAKVLLARLAESSVIDLSIKLKWKGIADLDMIVEEPLGAKADYDHPRTVFGGSLINNGRGTKLDQNTEEVYLCPRAFDGTYKIRLNSIYNSPEDPKKKVRSAELEIVMQLGSGKEKRQTFTVNLDQNPISPISIEMTGGRRTEVLPFLAPQAMPPLPKSMAKSRSGSQPEPKTKEALGSGASRSAQPTKDRSKAIVIPDYEPKSTKAIDLTNPKNP
jgi:hypothetical protein